MIIDGLLQFDPAGTAITASAASTNVLDLLNQRDLGVGDPDLKLTIVAQATFTASGAATLNIQFQGAPDNGSGAPGTYVTYAESGNLSIAQLNAGALLFPVDLPNRVAGGTPPRFYRLNYVVTTGPFTAGTLQAFLSLTADQRTDYRPGVVVNN